MFTESQAMRTPTSFSRSGRFRPCILQFYFKLYKRLANVFHRYESKKENPQKLTQLSPRSHPRHLMGKRTAQKHVIKDITSDSQVNSYFPYRWSPASLTINIYFTYFFLYLTRITINNDTPHLKSLKSQNRRAALGRPAIKLLGGGASTVSVDQPSPLVLPWYLRHLVVRFAWKIPNS